jgi:uncharacterized protein (TIGR00251 family)
MAGAGLALNVTGTDGGSLIEVKVSPGSSRDAVRGESGGRLKVAVTAPPERGRANAAVAKLLAKELGLPRSSVELVSGERSREKTFLVRGVGPRGVIERLGYLF